MPAVSGGDIEILLGDVQLHAAFGGELDMPVITGLVGRVGAREILRCDIIHLQDIDIEFVQGIDVLRDIIDVVEFKFQSGLRMQSSQMDQCAQCALDNRPFPDLQGCLGGITRRVMSGNGCHAFGAFTKLDPVGSAAQPVGS